MFQSLDRKDTFEWRIIGHQLLDDVVEHRRRESVIASDTQGLVERLDTLEKVALKDENSLSTAPH